MVAYHALCTYDGKTVEESHSPAVVPIFVRDTPSRTACPSLVIVNTKLLTGKRSQIGKPEPGMSVQQRNPCLQGEK